MVATIHFVMYVSSTTSLDQTNLMHAQETLILFYHHYLDFRFDTKYVTAIPMARRRNLAVPILFNQTLLCCVQLIVNILHIYLWGHSKLLLCELINTKVVISDFKISICFVCLDKLKAAYTFPPSLFVCIPTYLAGGKMS